MVGGKRRIRLNYVFPSNIEDYCKVYPGNTVLIEGQKVQGKSSFAMEFARLNCELFPGRTRYQNVEMSDDEIQERVEAYRIDIGKGEQWWREHVEFIRRTENWWDLINPKGLNIVDYVVEYEKAYLIATVHLGNPQAADNRPGRRGGPARPV